MANNDKNFKVKNGLDVKGSATVDNDLLVSGTLTAQVNTPTQDSDVVNKAYVDTIDTHDSAAVVGQINATVDQAFIDQFDTHDSAAVVGQINLEVDQAFIDQFDTHDSAAVQGQIDATLAVTDTHDSAAVEGQISARFAQDVTLSKDLTVDSDLTVNGVIKGPSTFIIDPALHGDSSGTLVILGNLQVDGVSTVIQSNTVSVTDKNIVLADSATNGTEANGAGITINGANASITYVVGNDNWEFNKAPYYLNERLLTTADDTHDSAAVVGQINDVVNQSYIDGFDTHDSAAVVGQINAEVDKAFVDALNVNADTLDGQHGTYYLDYNNFTNTPNILDSADVKIIADSAVDARTDQDLFTTSDVEFAKVTSNLVGSVHFTAQNDEGTALAKGDVVYIKGISGNTPTVAKADADDPTKMPAFGVVYAGANNGANVTITTLSVLEGIDTQTPGWSEGDTLYVSTVAGELTNVKPTGESSLIQNIGQVTRVDNSVGSIKILGAGRTAATPNLDQNRIFIGDASNQAITMSLDSAVDSDHVQSKIKQSFIDTFDTHDSAAVAGQIADTLNDTVTITKHSTTDPVLKLQSTVSTADAAPIMEFVRNTNQANNGDYLGQIKFLGEDSSGTADGSGIVYAKMTGKISDPTDGTEDGLIEYMVKSNGSNLIMARMTGNNGGKLIMENGAGIEVDSGGITVGSNGDITIAGNSVLTTASDTHDSAAVQGQIDANFASGFTVGGDITFSDSDDLIMPDKSQILLGDDGDLQIYHDGGASGNSRIRALNGDNLIIETFADDANIVLKTDNGLGGNPVNYIVADGGNGQVQLYHYGNQKFNTTSTGINVTGEVLADSATISGNLTVGTFSFANWTITESDGSLYFAKGGINKMKLDSDGNLDVVGSVNANATIS